MSPRRQPGCPDCRRPICWMLSPYNRSGWRCFEQAPVDGRAHVGATAFPVMGRQAWRTRDLIEELMGARSWSQAAAEEEVYALPWYVLHECPERRHV